MLAQEVSEIIAELEVGRVLQLSRMLLGSTLVVRN